MKNRKLPASPGHSLDSLFFRNTAGISAAEFFWGLGLPVLVESTFLQLYLRKLGASNLLIGMVPAILFAGLSVFGLFSGYLTSHLESKRKAIIVTHVFGSLPFPLLGIVLLATGFNSLSIPMFFVSYGLFSALLGLMVPLWQNYIVKIFSETRAVQGLSIMWIVQNITKIISSFIIARAVDRFTITAQSSGFIFILAGLSCLVGSFWFLVTREGEREQEEEPVEREVNFFRHLFRAGKTSLKDKNFIFFLVSDIETYAILGTVAFYANYAVEHRGISIAAASGLFIAFYYIGGFAANVFLGSLDLLPLKKKFYLSKVFSICALVLLILFGGLWSFLTASLFMGFSRSNRSLLYPVAVKQLVKNRDVTDHFALAYVIQLPVSVGLPLLSGRFLDLLSGYGLLSYKLLFTIMIGIVAMSTVFLWKTSFST